ncbi:toxin-antitoxin system YwqK family antitoxin [Hymenobacter sp. IS2118]|uniref:toxin-antitoxin system YwqK family antitoxin n=1 Tax=Hymenobacter sp. IS2118 TaxID=1505605 RepID=UPI0012685360|nr:hypothetical protein [Hymenobacter sp. IS2118]
MVKYLRLAILVAVFPTSLLAQRPKPAAVLSPPDTVYFDQDWDRTEVPEDRKFVRVARHTPEGKPSGTVRDYFFPSWKKQFEGKLLSESPDVPQGLCTGWYEDGKLNFRGTYVSGQQQPDFRQWHEDGREIKCAFAYQDALALSKAKLHSYYNDGSSRKVFTVDLPINTVGIVYKLDIRDDGEPPVSWATGLALVAAISNPALGATALLSAGSSALTKQNTSPAPATSTKCHWYITDDLEAAKEFMDTKGSISRPEVCYKISRNITQETREIKIKEATHRLFFCVNNNNSTTAATATLSVSALVQACE